MALQQQQQGGQQQPLLTLGMQQGQQQQPQQPQAGGAATPLPHGGAQQPRVQFPQNQLPANLHVQQQLLRMQQQQQGITAKLQGATSASGVQQRLLHLEQQEQFLQQQQQEPEKVHWVQCDRCDKWRVAPYEITQPSWVCEQNTWDRRYASCSVPEQPDPAAQMQQQQTRQQQQLLQQQQLQQQQLLQQQRFAGSSAPRPKAKAKAKSRAPSKGTAAVQRPLQTGNSAADAGPAAAPGENVLLAPGLIPAADAAASVTAHVRQNLLQHQMGQQQQRGGPATGGNLPALQQQLLQQQLQHQMQQAQQQQLLQQLQQQQHQLLQQLQQQPPVVFDNWVQCDACNKWRRAPNPITSDKWFCRMNTWAPQFASCEAPEEPDPAQQEQQQQQQQQPQQSQQRLLEAAAALQRQQQQLQQSAAKRQRTTSVSRTTETAKPDVKADPPTQLLRQQQLVAAAAASGQRNAAPATQQQLQLQQQLQQAKLPQAQQQQHAGSSASGGAGGQLQQLQLLQQQQLQLLQQQQVRLLDAARRATPNAAAASPGGAVTAAAAASGGAAGDTERREGSSDTAAASAAERGGKWLECRSCKKWRRLPPEVDAEALRPKFFCYLNMWDPQRNTCASPQEPWQQLQQQQEVQGKAPPANAAPAAALQKPQHQAAPSDANRQDKADHATSAPAQQQLPRAPGQLQGETSGTASLHQQLQEQQLLLLRMQQQQQQQRASASGVGGGSAAKPGSGASGGTAAAEDDDEEGDDDVEGEGDEDEDSDDTGDSSDSETDRGGGGGPAGGAGAGGPSGGGSSSSGAGAGGSAGRPAQPTAQAPSGTGNFGSSATGGGTVAGEVSVGVAPERTPGNSCTKTRQPARFFDVLIVGGGVAGLAGALHCQRAGVDYQVIEARGRLGGRVWSITLPASAGEKQPRRSAQKAEGACRRKGKTAKDGSVRIDGGANYMHGLTGNENDVRLKPRRRGCSVYHLAAASPECRVAIVPGETGWENPYYFDWLRGGRRFCMLVVSLAHALFYRLATPVSLIAAEQQTGSSVSILTLLKQEALTLLEAEEAAEAKAASSPCSYLPSCEIHHREAEGADTPPHQNTFESLYLPSALRGLVATLLRRLKDLCSLAVPRDRKNNSSTEIAVGECCACQVEAMVVRMLRSRFGFAAPLGDVSAALFAFFQTPALKRDVERLQNPRYRLLAWPGLRRYAENLSCAFAERDRKKSQAVRPFAAIPPSVSSDLYAATVDASRIYAQGSHLWFRLNTRVSFVSITDEDSAFPCLVRCHSDDGSSETQELRSRFVLVALPVSLLQQPSEKDEETAARVTFQPPLPAEKVAALAAMGMGVHNKVVLRVAPSDVFWSHSTPSFSSPYSCFQYLNLHAYGKTGCILAHLFPPASVAIDSLTDKEVAEEVLDDLRKLFGYVPRPALIASVVTRWHSDKYSRGSYSYPKPGADMATHWQWLRAPHPLGAPRVAFAGEFCSDSYNQFDTGMRAAQSVVQFGLRRHPCTKDRHEQKQKMNGSSAVEVEELQQQHRNRRQSRTIKETKSGSWQSRTKKKYRKEALDASEARARIAAARAELEQTNTKYCGDDCCPIVECPDSSHAGFYLTDGSDLTDNDDGDVEYGIHDDIETVYGENTRMMLEKFKALLRFNRKQLNCSQSRCSPKESGPAGFAQPAQARA